MGARIDQYVVFLLILIAESDNNVHTGLAVSGLCIWPLYSYPRTSKLMRLKRMYGGSLAQMAHYAWFFLNDPTPIKFLVRLVFLPTSSLKLMKP